MSMEKRITSALRSSSRLKDVESVIVEVQTAISKATDDLAAAEARSLDPALTTPEAREARNNAADLAHDIRRLNASEEQLVERRQAILSDEAYAERRNKFQAAKEERDALVSLLRSRYPALALELLTLVKRIAANDIELQAVNQCKPRDEDNLVSAEFIARGCNGISWGNLEPFWRIADASLPTFSGPGAYLPLNRNHLYQSVIDADQALVASLNEQEPHNA